MSEKDFVGHALKKMSRNEDGRLEVLLEIPVQALHSRLMPGTNLPQTIRATAKLTFTAEMKHETLSHLDLLALAVQGVRAACRGWIAAEGKLTKLRRTKDDKLELTITAPESGVPTFRVKGLTEATTLGIRTTERELAEILCRDVAAACDNLELFISRVHRRQ